MFIYIFETLKQNTFQYQIFDIINLSFSILSQYPSVTSAARISSEKIRKIPNRSCNGKQERKCT